MWTGFDVLLANRMHHQHSSWGGSAASCSEVVAQIKVNELVSYAEMETAWLRCVIKELKSDILEALASTSSGCSRCKVEMGADGDCLYCKFV